MSLARKVYDPQISSDDVQPGRARTRDVSVRRDLVELQRLVRVLERHGPVDVADCGRDLEILDDQSRIGRAEPHLRAVAALLVTLETYQTLKAGRRSVERRDTATVVAPVATLVPPVNGRPINGRPVDAVPVTSTGHDKELAAAAARYIARDLAARQLSEFTSAEGYRLARALAKLGEVEAPVERLLADANQVRLHPMPLADAVSHSPH